MTREVDELAVRFQAKAELRARIRAVRRAVPREARALRSSAIVAHAIALDELEHAKTVALYHPMVSEADPTAIGTHVRSRGARVVLPRVEVGQELLTWHIVDADHDLEESGAGFLQPQASSATVDSEAIDFVVIPAVAIDERGYRIGYGGGYYDRMLPKMKHAFRAVIGFDFQLLAELPNTPGDERSDVVITDRRTIRTGARGPEGGA